MDGQTFIFLLATNWLKYIIALIISMICSVPIFKVIKAPIIDPYKITTIFTVFANAIPIFLLFTNNISINDFIYFVLSEVLFLFGFLFHFNRELKINHPITIVNETKIYIRLFYIFFGLFLIFDLFTFKYFGIPLFLDYRMALYSNSGGFGIIARFLPLFKIYCIYYSLNEIIVNRKYSKLIIILIFIIDGILWGSKSGFIQIVFVYSFIIIKNEAYKISYKVYLVLGSLILLIGISGLLITNHSLEQSLVTFFYRFIASGDIYYYSYPDQLYKYVNIPDKVMYLPSFFLAPARLMNYLPYKSAGIQIYNIIHPYYIDAVTGPNPRMPIISYILFGWYGLILSFLAGRFISFFRRIIKYFFFNSLLLYPLYIYIMIESCFLLYDFAQGISNIFNILINIIVFFFFSFLVSLNSTSSNKYNATKNCK